MRCKDRNVFSNLHNIAHSSTNISVSAGIWRDVSDCKENREAVNPIPDPTNIPQRIHYKRKQRCICILGEHVLPECMGELLTDGHTVAT